ncbi:MAG: hypothetical protein E7354_03690 [Clostridiales bacterium]|nr:hypothetical protein [Clostridiales bacterium]
MAQNIKDYKKKIQTQNMIIVALAILIVVLIVVSSTAAWYIRTRSDTADIILSNPVNIYITEFETLLDNDGNVVLGDDGQPVIKHTTKTDILEEFNTKVYPGDKIKMKLGMQIGDGVTTSSPAYVRVKLEVAYENIYTGEISELQDLAELGQIEYEDEPDSSVWQKVDFNRFATFEGEESERPVDYWYVLKTTDLSGNTTAKVAYDREQFVFIDGYIILNRDAITNAQANCKIHINYVVEAIQIVNVPDPIVYQGYGPWWNRALGDIEDIPTA